jgi:hypothetical protein
MKRLLKISVFLLILLAPAMASAQPGTNKVEALRIAFISKRLELSSGESERFWPVYNEYNDKVKAVRRNLKEGYRERMGHLGDQEAEELYKLEIQSRQAEADLYRQYSEKLRAVIGVKKLARLHIAEDDFKQEILRTLKEKGD